VYAEIKNFAEDAGHILTILSFFVFGSVVLAPAMSIMSWRVALYAVLSLTAVRIVPVLIAMYRAGLERPSLLYLGWFGPRGLASIILVLTVLDTADLPGADTINVVMAATVGLSVYAHGLTAWWGSNRYADWYTSTRDRHDRMHESRAVPEVAVSRRLGPRHDTGG
jgi:NhaP-type Na+/H+ or K+/H+ antiporter